MKICISQNVVEFGPSEKTFNERHLKIRSSVGTNIAVINRTGSSQRLPYFIHAISFE